ncbi:MAG: histidine phosphatase family protein [Patescibacteria group bacterium]
MKNRYIFVRHGKSVSNERKLICSSMDNGILPEFALVPEGMRQVFEVAELLTDIVDIPKSIVFCSPFSRTLQTGLIIKQVMGLPHFVIFCDHKLIERGFSPYELQTAEHYQKVWKADSKGEIIEGVETPIQVSMRISDFVDKCEAKFNNKDIIVISHGDVIMIARTYFLGVSPFKHRDYPFIENAKFIIFDKDYKRRMGVETDILDF